MHVIYDNTTWTWIVQYCNMQLLHIEFSVGQKQIFSLMKEQEEAKETIVKLKDDKKDLMVYSFHVHTHAVCPYFQNIIHSCCCTPLRSNMTVH